MAFARDGDDGLLEGILTPLKDYIKDDLKKCLLQGSIQKHIDDNTALADLKDTKEAVWTILVLCGLLNAERMSAELYKLTVPNMSCGLFIVKLILKWENRILSPEQVAAGDYTVVPEDPIKLQMWHHQNLEKIGAQLARSSASDSKVATPIGSATASSSSSISSHAVVSASLSTAAAVSAITSSPAFPKVIPSVVLSTAQSEMTPSPSLSLVSSTSSSESKTFGATKKSSATDEKKSTKNFGSTFSGLRGAFTSRG